MSIIGLKQLCPPAEFYFVISIISLVIMCFQNFGTTTIFCLGNFGCYVNTIFVIFFTKLIYILVFTWILNIICRKVSRTISWLIALIPFILFFLSLSLIMLKTL